MHGGKRIGSGRKNKTKQLKRELVTIRLPNWMILQIKNKGEIGYIIENQLIKMDFLSIPNVYIKGS